MQIIEQLAQKKHLKIEDVERLKYKLIVKKDLAQHRISNKTRQLRPKFSILSLFRKKRTNNKVDKRKQQKNTSSIAQGLFIGYRLAKGWRRFFKKK